ncbi:HTH-type transcriptional regulator VirS [compost metagenome]
MVQAAQALQPAPEEIDYWFANQLRYQKSVPGAPPTLLRVRLRRDPPDDPKPWRKIAGGAVEFGAERDELVMDMTALQAERPAGSPAVCSALENALLNYAEQTAQGTLLEQVATAVLAGMQHELGLDELAEQLHMTSRTLHRALLREGWRFSEIVDVQRRYLAWDLLEEGTLDIGEVAQRLGYRELRSFSRAFRRWYGTSPGALRQENRAV